MKRFIVTAAVLLPLFFLHGLAIIPRHDKAAIQISPGFFFNQKAPIRTAYWSFLVHA